MGAMARSSQIDAAVLLRRRAVAFLVADLMKLGRIHLQFVFWRQELDFTKGAYDKFFDMWKDADPDLPILIEARRTYKELMN